ncbi:MAG: histidine kinase [Bacteroidia bacterium]
MRRVLCLGLLLLSTFSITSAMLPVSKLVLPIDGSIKTQNACLYQDKDGYIYLGNEEGLYRFNGRRWKQLPSDQNYIGRITAIHAHQGVLWAGSSKGSLGFIRNDSLILFRPQEGLPHTAITSLQSTGDHLWLGTKGEGVYCQTPIHQYLFDEYDGIADLNIQSLVAINDGIWAGTDNGLFQLNFKDGRKSTKRISTHDQLIAGMARVNKQYWVAYQSGEFGPLDGTLHQLPSLSGGIRQFEYHREKLWILDLSGHLWVFDLQAKQLEEVHLKHSGRRLRAESFMIDQKGSFWLLTNVGLISSQPGLSHYTIPAGINIQAIHQDEGRHLFLGTNKGLWHGDPSATGGMIAASEGLNVLSLHQDRLGRLWIGTYGQGLYLYENKRFIKFGLAEGLTNDNIFSFAECEETGRIYLATLGGIFYIDPGDKKRPKIKAFHHNHPDGPGTYYIYQLHIDRNKNLWIGSDGKGIFRYKDDTFKQFTQANKRDFRIVSSIGEDTSGTVWFHALDAGIFAIKEGKPVLVSDQNTDDITSLTGTFKGNLFIGRQHGLAILNRKTNRIFELNQMFELPYAELLTNAIYRGKEVIYIGGRDGLFRLHTKLLPEFELPNIRIGPALMANGEPIGNTHRFPAKQQNINFELDILWFAKPEAIKLRYKLEGLHTEWVNAERYHIQFQGLRPGDYQLIVEVAMDDSFKLANSASYAFKINKPIYASWWFVSLLFGSFLSILIWYLRWREQENKLRETLKRERIRAQFEVLKSQISPHFLFNAFNTLIELIEEDQKQATKYVEKLSALFRTVLEYKDTDLIPLSEEIELVKTYIYLQKQRFGETLQATIQINEEAQKLSVIPMSLQLLVENAIKHNSFSKAHPLHIQILAQENQIVVKNNLKPKSMREPSTGFGLNSLRQRYRNLYQLDIAVIDDKNEFEVIIPSLKTS